jgi:hypothetical protein
VWSHHRSYQKSIGRFKSHGDWNNHHTSDPRRDDLTMHFSPPPLLNRMLRIPIDIADALSNMNYSLSLVSGVWRTNFEPNPNEPAHLPMIGGLDENQFTNAVGLQYPPDQDEKGYATEAGNATSSTTRSMALAHTSGHYVHFPFIQHYHFIWDLFISCKSAYTGWDFFTSEYDHWSQQKRSIWFTLLVENVAYFLMWQMMLGKKGLRFLGLGKNGSDVWGHIIDASYQLAKDTLLSRLGRLTSANNTASIYTVEYITGPHPSAALPGNFLSIDNRRILDQALTAVNRETLERYGRRDEDGNVVGITHYADTCPKKFQNISNEMLSQIRRDDLKRRGGYVGPAVWEFGRPQTQKEKQDERHWLTRGSYVTRLGNEMQKLYTTPFAKMSDKDLYAVFVAKSTEQGINSSATDEGRAVGEHYLASEDRYTMSMSDRAKEATGVPKTGGKASTTLILHDQTDENNVHIYYSLTDKPMAQKLFDLKAFNSERNAVDNMKRLKDYAGQGKFKLVQGSANGRNSSKAAAGSKMPLHLNLWLSVGKVPEGENVKQLVNQSKRKRAEE